MIAIGPNISLGEALEVEGLRVKESIDRFLPYNMVNVREYPAMVIPLYLLLRPAWPLFGKQFLVVATKP